MSRQKTLVLIVTLVLITFAGYFVGKVILPRVFLKTIEKHLEPPESHWDNQEKPNLASMISGIITAVFGPKAQELEDDPGLAEGAGVGGAEQFNDEPIPTGSATEPNDNQDSLETAETAMALGSMEDVVVDVDVTEQIVRILKDGKVLKEMIASTGVEGHETPLGNFEIENRGLWFFSDKYKQGAKYWVSFRDWGLYLFHSLAMDENQNVIPEEEAKLGQPASHGCVRLKIEDAKWIYDNIPAKTRVVIHE